MSCASALREVPVDANAMVSYNVRAIRLRRRWTQQDVAERLATLTGRVLPQASISAMERGVDGGGRRRFDGHELYLLAAVFDVPIIYFFLPPPSEATSAALADTGQPLADLYATALGSDAQQLSVDQRMAEMGPGAAERVLGEVFGAGPDWAERFKAWRNERFVDVERDCGERLADVGAFLVDFAQALSAVSPVAYLRELAAGGDRPRP